MTKNTFSTGHVRDSPRNVVNNQMKMMLTMEMKVVNMMTKIQTMKITV